MRGLLVSNFGEEFGVMAGSGRAHDAEAILSIEVRPERPIEKIAVNWPSTANMRIFVGVTDKEWFTLHASRANVDEVNFWRPSPEQAAEKGHVLGLARCFCFLGVILGG
jgi:hypothetical protein